MPKYRLTKQRLWTTYAVLDQLAENALQERLPLTTLSLRTAKQEAEAQLRMRGYWKADEEPEA